MVVIFIFGNGSILFLAIHCEHNVEECNIIEPDSIEVINNEVVESRIDLKTKSIYHCVVGCIIDFIVVDNWI
jgi:hypothetical protein